MNADIAELPGLSARAITERYGLLCRATRASADASDGPQEELLDKLQRLIKQDLVSLARQGSPDDFADIYFSLEQELERFREFCAFPALARKVVVGFGGAFSSGKSSLINAVLGKRLLVAEVDPTTTLPTYLLHGEQDEIHALNLFRRRITISHEEFLSLTHEEVQTYGSNVSSLLQAAFRTVGDFAWHNLALVDTPGYSKPDSDSWSTRTDEHVARAQLNAAQAIVWVVSAEAGTISENDLAFLASLRPEIPRLVVLSRADKKQAPDIASIVAVITRTLAERNLPVLGVIPISAHKKNAYPLQPVFDQLQAWNSQPRELRFTHNFKRQFTRYARYLNERQRSNALHLNRLNRMLALSDSSEVQQDAQELKTDALAAHQRLEASEKELHALRQRFFAQLKQIGDTVGIPLPEPADIDLIDIGGFDLLGLLRQAREQRGDKENDYRQHWRILSTEGGLANVPQIVRRVAARHSAALQSLPGADHSVDSHHLLRRASMRHGAALQLLSGADPVDSQRLVRRAASRYDAALQPLSNAESLVKNHALLRRNPGFSQFQALLP